MRHRDKMTYDPTKHHRRSIRLRGYDYRQAGAYFVTICTQSRECTFGQVVEGRMILNAPGQMVELVWRELHQYYPGIETDAFVVMPNHVHGIITLVGAGPRACPDKSWQPQGVAPTAIMSLPDVVHRLKSLTTAKYRRGVIQDSWPAFPGRLWQRNYYEHVIRHERELDAVRRYIEENPLRWDQDPENPAMAQAVGDHRGLPLHPNGDPL
jgi:putative transposase